jgi:hypothetical protein
MYMRKLTKGLFWVSIFLFKSSFAQQTLENIERGISIMESKGELRREGNKLIFLKISAGDTAFYKNMYLKMFESTPNNPYSFAFEIPTAKPKKLKETKPISDSGLTYQIVTPLQKASTKIDYPNVSFNANITTRRSNPSSPLQFESIENNDGNAFSLVTSSFTAPTNGLYFFSLSIIWSGYCNWSVGGSAAVTLLKNNTVSIGSHTTQTFSPEAFSNTFSLSTKLNRGDVIKVIFTNQLCDHGGEFPTIYLARFSGYRVYAN